MTDILCRWLNEELKISKRVDQASFAHRFSSGYLIGEVLHKYQLQDDFDQFSQSRTADSKLHNFTLLEPVLHLLGIPFDTALARDIMTEKHGTATRLLYQLYIALNNKKKANLTGVAMETLRPAAPAKLNAIESGIYKELTGDKRLKHVTPRQTDLNLEDLASKFHEHQIRMEQTAFVERFMEGEARYQEQQNQRKILLERSRLLRAKQSEMVAKIKAATIYIPKPPANLTAKAQELQKTARRKQEAEETINAINRFEDKMKLIILPDDAGDDIDIEMILKQNEDKPETLNFIKVCNDEYIGKIRKRLQEDSAAREEREKRRRKVLREQMSAHLAQEEARREEMMVNRLMRQSQQERRIAVQLLQARHEKEVIRNNRIICEQQYQERRLRDFEDALNREAELARLYKEEYREQIQQEQERHDTIAAQRAEERYRRHYDLNYEIVGQIVDFVCKIAEYRELTEKLLPPKLMRDWTTQFISGIPLHETKSIDTGEPTPEQILEEERQMLLDEGDLIEYKEMIGEWQPPEVTGITGPSRNNPIVGHIIHRLYNIVYPPSPPPPPPEFPPFPIRACVLGKGFAGKSTIVRKIADEHRLQVLNVDKLVTEAIEAHQNNELQDSELGLLLEESSTTSQAADLFNESCEQPAKSLENIVETSLAPEGSIEMQSQRQDVSAVKQESMEILSKRSSIQIVKSSRKFSRDTHVQPSVRAKLGFKALKTLKKGRPVDDQTVVEILADAIRHVPEGTGWIIDGYPQNYNQAKLLEKALSGFDTSTKDNKQTSKTKLHRSSLVQDPRPPPPPKEPASGIDVVIVFDINDELCIKRACGRTYASQADQQYHEEFKPPPDGSATGVGKQEKVIPVSDPAYDLEQIQHRITAFLDTWPKLEKWYKHFGILQRVDATEDENTLFLEVEKILEETLAKLQGKDQESSAPIEKTEVSESIEQIPAAPSGAPPDAVTEVSQEEPAPGGPGSGHDLKTSRASSKSGSITSAKTPPRSASKESQKDSAKKKDKTDAQKGSRVSSAKSGRSGKKRKTPEPEREPEPEVSTGPPPPQPGDEEWEFVDQLIEQDLAVVLSSQWDTVEKTYLNNCKYVFRHVRQERENIYRYFYQIRKDFLAYLRRPDHKQEFVAQWQKDYNAVPDDMRDDEETRAELHQRVDDLREKLWNICDERKDQAENEREAIMTDGWLDDHMGILSNHYITLMQGEIDRFQDTVRLLKDYYRGMEGHIPDALNMNYERLAIFELPAERPEGFEPLDTDSPQTPPVSDDTLKTETPKSPRVKSPKERKQSPKERAKSPKGEGLKSRSSSGKKLSRFKEPEVETISNIDVRLRIKVPLIPRRSSSPDGEGKSGIAASKDKKDKKIVKKVGEEFPGIDSPQPPQDPDERLLYDAYCNAFSSVGHIIAGEMAIKEAEEEAERARQMEKEKEKEKLLKKNKKGGKGRSPSPKKGKEAPSISPALSSEDMTEEEKQKKLMHEKINQEYYFTIKEEEVATKKRIDLIKAVSLAVIQDLKIKGDNAFKDMNDWLGARFLKEMESIDTLSEVMRNAIETRQKLKEQIIIQQEDFYVDSDHLMLKSPKPPSSPEKAEVTMPDHFTVNQLFNLYQQFQSIAPTGIMSVKSFCETFENLVSVTHGMEQLPDMWMNITVNQIQDIASSLATESDYVDWRRFLVALTWPIPTPTQEQLLAIRHRFCEMDQKETGFVSREQYNRMELWFSTNPPGGSLETYNRLSHLKRILFDMFAEHSGSLPKLNYINMLLYFSAVLNPYEGFLRALSVVAGTHMPRLQKPVLAMEAEKIHSISESIMQESAETEDKEGRMSVEPPMTGEEIPLEALEAVVLPDHLLTVSHHGQVTHGDSDRFSVGPSSEDSASRDRLAAVFTELGGSSQKPLPFRILIEHPFIQDMVTSCNSFKALDLKALLAPVDSADHHSLKMMD